MTRKVLWFFVLLIGMPAIYFIYATSYMNNATYDLQSPRLTVTGAPGQSIFFKITLKDNIGDQYAGSPVNAQLEGVPQELTVIPEGKDTTGGDIQVSSRGSHDYTITGSLTLPSTLGDRRTVSGKISGNISYPEALGNGRFTYKLLLINVPIHIQLVAPLEFLFSSGRPWFYVLAMLNTLLMLSIYHLPGLRFQLRAVKGHTVRDVAAGHCLLRFLALLILPIVVVALLSMGGIGIRGTPVYMPPWNEVELWGAIIAGAFLLSTLFEAIRWFHLFRQST